MLGCRAGEQSWPSTGARPDAPEDLADLIALLLKEHPTMPWHVALRQIADSAP
jgi:hypothetical protein